MEHLYVEWDEYHRLIERLALQIHDSGYRFDAILCLARGGLRIGDVLSRIYDRPLAILATVLAVIVLWLLGRVSRRLGSGEGG